MANTIIIYWPLFVRISFVYCNQNEVILEHVSNHTTQICSRIKCRIMRIKCKQTRFPRSRYIKSAEIDLLKKICPTYCRKYRQIRRLEAADWESASFLHPQTSFTFSPLDVASVTACFQSLQLDGLRKLVDKNASIKRQTWRHGFHSRLWSRALIMTL